MIEHAVMQILESLSGNQNARIDCDDEGNCIGYFMKSILLLPS